MNRDLLQYERATDYDHRQQDMQPTTFAALADALRHIDVLQRVYPGYPVYLALNPIAEERHEYEVWGDASHEAYVPAFESMPF